MNTTEKPFRSSVYKYAKDADTFLQMDKAIQKNLPALRKKGVISIRPGYKEVGGWLTRKPAIVVTVVSKKESLPSKEMLPIKVGGFAVDVRQASPVEKLRAEDPQRYSQLVASGRGEYNLPRFEYEREPESGQPLSLVVETAELEAGAVKPEISYSPAPGVSLDAVEAPMSILCHASPDAGWPQLKNFFDQIQSNLTIGLYDFTSAHILQGLSQSLKKSQAVLTLTLDHPIKNPTADQTDDETVDHLQKLLRDKMSFAWALVRSSKKAHEWVFPTAYHIKVAVRDGSSMWLSSGNWNNSNQPDIDPLGDPNGSGGVAKKSDRDWHIIVNHGGLAQTYEAFLKHDFEVANEAGQAALAPLAGIALLPEQNLNELAEAIGMEGRVPSRYFSPLRIPASGTKNIRIQPILTPDNYCDHVLPLIQSAQRSFYMQTQYVHPSENTDDQRFADLVNAVIALQQKGVDTRIILSQYQKQGGWLDKLQEIGTDLSSVRIQNGVHNKGIVVDSQVVMLGSQNWSGDGVLQNRDASVILYDEEAAKYYEGIFLHDWAHMAFQTI